MKCPSCQHENPDDAKFCNECAHKLELICPACGKVNPLGSKFCNECAHDLSIPSEPVPKELSFDEKIEKIQKYLPKGITEKILSQRDKIEGEKKQVTVMFADMVRFTPLVEKLGPEEAYSIMDQVYEILIHKVHDYDGTVNEMTGDGIMALFGAPIALEDAPQRAIRSAYAIHMEMTRFSGSINQEKESIHPLKMRIGVHTGPVVLGTLGNDLRVEFKVVGDTVNIAKRMEELAEPGATYVTEETFKLTEGLFRFESLGEKGVKGKKEPVRTYRVIGPSTRRTRFDVSAEQGLTPFTGRERELEILIDGLERVKRGRGQAFSIVAEAGIGKSRLLYEFRKTMANEDITFLEGKCLSYGQTVGYHPIIDLFKSNFDIREHDDSYQIKDKIENGLKQLDLDEDSTLPYLLDLLSVEDSGIDQTLLSPEVRKDRMVETMIRIPLKGSEIRPLILAIEDLHWIDKSSNEVLKYLFDNISGERVLLLFTYRPDFIHTWSARSYYNQLTLNRLSNRESLSMCYHLLGTANIDAALEDVILEKTEGVPFFIEEFIKSLQDLKLVEQKNNRYILTENIRKTTVPTTINDVIMARVDSLPDDVREVLQIGSVIGREFEYELIKKVSDIPQDQLLEYLSYLKDSELLYERGIFPRSIYVFKHALTREAIYDSILNKRKKILHEAIGNVIEEMYKGDKMTFCEILSHHYGESDDHTRAAEYSGLSAEKAASSGLADDAIDYTRKQLVSLEVFPQTEQIRRELINTRALLGIRYLVKDQFFEAKKVIDPVFDEAVEMGSTRSLAYIYSIIGNYYSMIVEDYPKSFEYFKNALIISSEINDPGLQGLSDFWFSIALALNCDFDESFFHINRFMELSEDAQNHTGTAHAKSAKGYIYFLSGNIEQGYQSTLQSIKYSEMSGDRHSKAVIYGRHGMQCYAKGYFEEGVRYLSEGIELLEALNFYSQNSMVQLILGEVFVELGNYERANECYDDAIINSEKREFSSSWTKIIEICKTYSILMNGERNIDLERIFHFSTSIRGNSRRGWIAQKIGSILLDLDEKYNVETEKWIQKAIEADQKNGLKWYLGRDYALYAELFKRKSDRSKARENMNKAIEIMKECGADGWVEKYEKELAEL